jgi:hypothetical protein
MNPQAARQLGIERCLARSLTHSLNHQLAASMTHVRLRLSQAPHPRGLYGGGAPSCRFLSLSVSALPRTPPASRSRPATSSDSWRKNSTTSGQAAQATRAFGGVGYAGEGGAGTWQECGCLVRLQQAVRPTG